MYNASDPTSTRIVRTCVQSKREGGSGLTGPLQLLLPLIVFACCKFVPEVLENRNSVLFKFLGCFRPICWINFSRWREKYRFCDRALQASFFYFIFVKQLENTNMNYIYYKFHIQVKRFKTKPYRRNNPKIKGQ